MIGRPKNLQAAYTPDRRMIHRSDRERHLPTGDAERLAEAGIESVVGSVGDSYDDALAETINRLYRLR